MSRLITDVGLLPLTTSLVGTSVLFFGVGLIEFVGPVALVRNKLGELNLKKNEKVRIWAAYFRRVAVFVVGSVAVVGLTSAYAAYQTINPDIAKYSWIAAGTSVVAVPYTLTVLQPTNSKLLALSDASGTRELSETEGKEVDQLIEKWTVLHIPRLVLYGASWTASLLALTTAVSGFKW